MLTELHRAVIAGDLSAVFSAAADPETLLLKDDLGFTASDLAILLGHSGCAEALGICWQSVSLESEIGYSPCLSVSSYETLKEMTRAAPLWIQYSPLGRDARDLGRKRRSAIFSGQMPPCEIQVIDEHIGRGLFASTGISNGTYVGNYAGHLRLITKKQRDWNAYCVHYPTRFYRRGLYIVDALEKGNATRFINHSDTPNLRVEYALDRGLLHLLIFADRDLMPGDQLTLDYGPDYWQHRGKLAL